MPRTSAPAKKVNALIEHLAGLAEAPTPDEFSLQRIARDANALMKSDRAGAHTVLGGVAALQGDVDETRRHYRTALNIDNSITHLFNYSVSLSLLEEHDEALEVAVVALKAYPDDLNLLNGAMKVALESANFGFARDLSNRWDVLSPNHPNLLSRPARQLARAVETDMFTEQGVRGVLRIVAATQRSENVRTSNIGFSSYNTAESFLYQRSIPATPTLAAALNERLSDQIAERPDLLADPGLRFVAVFTAVPFDVRNA